MASPELHSAYILHNRAYRDSSALLEIFSHDQGRTGLVARGVRSAKSRYAGLLQPFVPLYLSWVEHGELGTLRNAEAAGRTHGLDGQRLISGFYLNELLLRLLHRHDPHPYLFETYIHTLNALASGQQQETALRRFERILLQEIGYGLILEHEVQRGEKIDPEARYCYQLEHGPIEWYANAEGIAVQGKTLYAIAADHYPDEQMRREAKQLMRAALNLHLGERPLHSRQLYRQQQTL